MAKDRKEIERVVGLYIDGVSQGNAAKLREAFHPDARMFGSFAGQRVDVPIEELFAMCDGKPMKTDDRYKARIVSVDEALDAAAAVIEEDGCWGTVSFRDYFHLARIDGRWKIVNKIFAHTGGTPPKA